jgi:hypothetical protein
MAPLLFALILKPLSGFFKITHPKETAISALLYEKKVKED